MRTWWICVLTVTLVAFTTSIASAAKKDPNKPKPTPEEVFKKRDKNGDNALSLEEFVGKKGGDKAKAAFAKKDKDGNGSVSLEEFTAKGKGKKAKK